jgi:hypothetical protein
MPQIHQRQELPTQTEETAGASEASVVDASSVERIAAPAGHLERETRIITLEESPDRAHEHKPVHGPRTGPAVTRLPAPPSLRIRHSFDIRVLSFVHIALLSRPVMDMRADMNPRPAANGRPGAKGVA